MGQSGEYAIGVLGLSDSEMRVIRSLSALTHGRQQASYALVGGNIMADADIVIVNVDDIDSVQQLRLLSIANIHAVLAISAKVVPVEFSRYKMSRPFAPVKLLAMLDVISGDLRKVAEVWKSGESSTPVDAAASLIMLRALVVDDSPTVRKQLELELSDFNILSDTVESGEAALKLLERTQYDLIFLDVVLPGMDGYHICKEVRKNPKTKQLPVIMLTSKSSPFDRVRGSLVGCSAYLTKPVDPKLFRDTVEKYMGVLDSHH